MGDKVREEFEDVESSQGEWPRAVEKNARGEYILMATANAWNTWQDAWKASRDDLAVELPTAMDGPDGDGLDGNYEEFEMHEAVAGEVNCMRAKCRAAIESAGIKVKS